jgi:Type I phosphodiesterase / nucleotide pyrophosphatase
MNVASPAGPGNCARGSGCHEEDLFAGPGRDRGTAHRGLLRRARHRRHGVAGTTSAPPQTYLCLVVVDGFRPDYREFARTPNIDALMKRGVTYRDSWVGQLMNVTPPGHVGLSTGLLPDKTDVCFFAWKDQDGILHQYYSYDNAIEGVTNRMLAAKGIKGLGSRYQAAYPQAVTAAVTAGNFYALSALAADGVDVELGCDMTGVTGVESSAPRMKPVAYAGTAAAAILGDPALTRDLAGPQDEDTWAMDAALAVLEQERPGVLMINLSFTDTSGHLYGNIAARDKMKIAVENADAQIGRLIAQYKALGLYDQTVFAIASDHGQNPSPHWIDKDKIEALVTKAGGKVQLLVYPDLYLADPSASKAVAESIAKAGLKGSSAPSTARRPATVRRPTSRRPRPGEL